MHSFAENWITCCNESAGWILSQKGEEDSFYREQQQICDALYTKLETKLEDGDKGLVDKFDAAKNTVQAIEEQYLYQQAFRDCVYLLEWIGIL